MKLRHKIQSKMITLIIDMDFVYSQNVGWIWINTTHRLRWSWRCWYFPLHDSLLFTAKYTPQQIAVTVNREQELRLRLETNIDQDHVWWQKEPVQSKSWYKADVTEDKTLKIAYSQLQGSGLYSITDNKENPVKKTFGTFSVIMRGGSFDICGLWIRTAVNKSHVLSAMP